MELTLREWRKAKGIPVTRLANELGVNYSTMVRWEQGAKMPVDKALRACDFIGVNINDVNFFDLKRNKNVASGD